VRADYDSKPCFICTESVSLSGLAWAAHMRKHIRQREAFGVRVDRTRGRRPYTRYFIARPEAECYVASITTLSGCARAEILDAAALRANGSKAFPKHAKQT